MKDDEETDDGYASGDQQEEEEEVVVNKPSSGSSNNKNDKTETGNVTTEAAETEKGGCGSVVGVASVALMAVLAGAAVVLKKED